MNKLLLTINNQTKPLLNMYTTAGYPQLNDTITIVKTFETSGADIVEIGMPYSDPLADGPTIQKSNMKALNNGMNMEVLFNQVNELKSQVTIPIILMGYLNPIIQFGVEKFISLAALSGVSGFIIPDLPLIEFKKIWKPLLHQNNLCFIQLITPQTSDERVKELDSESTGFIYAIAQAGLTGVGLNNNIDEYLKRLKGLELKNKIFVGFGIRNKENFKNVTCYADGGIIASAFIDELEKSTDIITTTQNFVSSIIS